jgi:hypothetical protein
VDAPATSPQLHGWDIHALSAEPDQACAAGTDVMTAVSPIANTAVGRISADLDS